MRGSARNDTTERACREVVSRVKLNLSLWLQCAKFVCHCVVCEALIVPYRGLFGLLVDDVPCCLQRVVELQKHELEKKVGYQKRSIYGKGDITEVGRYIFQSTMTVVLQVRILVSVTSVTTITSLGRGNRANLLTRA